MHEQPATEGGTPQGALQRAFADALIGAHRARERHQRVLQTIASGEYDQQVQVPFSGVASAGWGYTDTAVSWEHPFIYSPLQRNVPFETPHVTHHLEFTGKAESDGLVIGLAHVIGWNQTDSGWYIGATVRIAICAPNASANVPYEGVVHLTFEGFAFPTDTGEEDI